MADKKRQAVDSAVQAIISGQAKAQAKAGKVTPLGVKLDPAEIAQLDRAAADLEVSRHSLLQYAIRQFLADWQRGERPEITTRAVRVLHVPKTK